MTQVPAFGLVGPRRGTGQLGPVLTALAKWGPARAKSTVRGHARSVAPPAGLSSGTPIQTCLQLASTQHRSPSWFPRVLAAAEGTGSRPQEAPQPAVSGAPLKRLAFVEDSPDDYRMLARVFRECGTLIHWASAEEALSAFERGDVDLADLDALIVDLHLPGIDGVELVRAARELPGGASPAICMLTSSASQNDIDRARRAGADGYLVKPHGVAGLRELPVRVAEIAASR